MNARLLPLTIAALIALSACGDGDTAAQPTASAAPAAEATSAVSAGDENTVTITRSRFENGELRISAGTTVTFVNADPFAHTVTSKDGAPLAFDSGVLGENETFEFTFDEPGEYPYFCEIHPTMRAVVIVE